ncbi:MAG: ABC transporter substrate-binding protein [Alphaproteobacteria bacterium]|nr:ABC transporter substrate-binding protein [Alphaproteobacteria bacterium]
MTMKISRRGLALGVAAAAVLGFASAGAKAETIKVGSFLAVTGPAAFLGDPEKKTLELYVEKINKDGGILGKQVELIVYDVQHVADKARTAAKRLIEQDKVDFIIGGSTTGTTMAVVPLVEKAEIPFISLGGASVIVQPVKKWVFKTPHTDRMAVEKVYTDMKKEGISKVGLIAGSGGFDKSCLKNAKDLAGPHGMDIVASETYGKGDTDMTPQLTKIKSANPQGVLFCGFGAPAVTVTKNYRQLGIAAPLYHNHGSGSKKFVQGAGKAAEGVRLPAAALLVADQLPGADPQRQPALDYQAAYRERYGEDISTFGGHALDALMLMKAAMEKAGTTDKAKVRAELETTKNFIGVDGIFNMTTEDHMGLDLASFKMVEVRNGDWKFLY